MIFELATLLASTFTLNSTRLNIEPVQAKSSYSSLNENIGLDITGIYEGGNEAYFEDANYFNLYVSYNGQTYHLLDAYLYWDGDIQRCTVQNYTNSNIYFELLLNDNDTFWQHVDLNEEEHVIYQYLNKELPYSMDLDSVDLDLSGTNNNTIFVGFRFYLLDAFIYNSLINVSNVADTSYQKGYEDGQADSQQAIEDAEARGLQRGFNNGVAYAQSQNSTALTIFTGIINIALLPINFFLACLNFEVFGINIGAFVSALLTVAIIVIISRTIFNGGNKSD